MRFVLRATLKPVLVCLVLMTLASPVHSQSAIVDYRSKNFLVHTDLGPKEAEALLVKLETMLRIVSAYWGTKNRKTIECNVIDRLGNWSESGLDQNALRQSANGGGLTLSQTTTFGRQFDTKAIVFASSKRGTPLHEAVHAFCALNFGRMGPTWYSEGMAEMGNFWDENDPTVTAPDYVINYLRRSEPLSLRELTDPKNRTGDGWQNYAWRWALCHMLANNPNYAARFRVLGLAMLTNKPNATFAKTFGRMREELEFEYRFFLKHLGRGFDAGACAWDWKTKFKSLRGSAGLASTIKAKGGWQVSRLRVKKGESYSYVTDGKWRTNPDMEWLTADGDGDGDGGGKGDKTSSGRLMGVVLVDGLLKAPIELGAAGTFKAQYNGDLYLRCFDSWTSVTNNDGKMKVTLKKSAIRIPQDNSSDNSADDKID